MWKVKVGKRLVTNSAVTALTNWFCCRVMRRQQKTKHWLAFPVCPLPQLYRWIAVHLFTSVFVEQTTYLVICLHSCVLILLWQLVKVRHTVNRDKSMAKFFFKKEAVRERMLWKKKQKKNKVWHFLPVTVPSSLLEKLWYFAPKITINFMLSLLGNIWFANFQFRA